MNFHHYAHLNQKQYVLSWTQRLLSRPLQYQNQTFDVNQEGILRAIEWYPGQNFRFYLPAPRILSVFTRDFTWWRQIKFLANFSTFSHFLHWYMCGIRDILQLCVDVQPNISLGSAGIQYRKITLTLPLTQYQHQHHSCGRNIEVGLINMLSTLRVVSRP